MTFQPLSRDEFTGTALVYQRTDSGHLLYSVGLNMQDERARKDRKADDIAVTMDGESDESELP